MANDNSKTSDALTELAINGKWEELEKSALASLVFNTRIIFLAALEQAAKQQSASAREAAHHLLAPMQELIEMVIADSPDFAISSEVRASLADAWSFLAAAVANHGSEEAALAFSRLSSLVQEESRLRAAITFYNNRRWAVAAGIFESIPHSSPIADINYFRKLGICYYMLNNYSLSAAMLVKAAQLGDESPETVSYLTWLDEKLGKGGANTDE